MGNLQFFKKATVEQIHSEFDSAQQLRLSECDRILSELKVPKENQVERKANILKELGFINSAPVKEANELKEVRNRISSTIRLTSNQSNEIIRLKQEYPLEKYITVDDLNRICAKYKLIYSPASRYIKDIPEKNAIEMYNCKKLKDSDKPKDNEYLFKVKNFNRYSKHRKFLRGKEFKIELSGREYDVLMKNNLDSDAIIASKLELYIGPNESLFKNFYITKLENKGIFIAAPKSHFNLKGLKNKGFGFFDFVTHEVNDPIAFEYCNHEIVRIISKWGTKDDQSYLDPSLVNEKLN